MRVEFSRLITLNGQKNKFNPFKSPDGEGIFSALLQKGPDSLFILLCNLFRASIAFSYIPQVWKATRVVFIPKHGHNNYTEAKAYRPISLASFLLKSLERLIERYICKRVLLDTPLHRNHHAYQSLKTCKTALHSLVSRLEDSMEWKEIALGAFLDIEGAFDNTFYESIVLSAHKYGVNDTICRWINSMLRCRNITASLLGRQGGLLP